SQSLRRLSPPIIPSPPPPPPYPPPALSPPPPPLLSLTRQAWFENPGATCTALLLHQPPLPLPPLPPPPPPPPLPPRIQLSLTGLPPSHGGAFNSIIGERGCAHAAAPLVLPLQPGGCMEGWGVGRIKG
ncbi:unnamed protein product, partial [Closterium sp. NIES-53]